MNEELEAELVRAQRAVDLAIIKTNNEWSKVVAIGGRSFQINDELGKALEEETGATEKRDQVRRKIRGEDRAYLDFLRCLCKIISVKSK